RLLLGPFCGRPACQHIPISPGSPGVCAAAFLHRAPLLVPDVRAFPGHIACDADTRSELVLPLLLTPPGQDDLLCVGVLDLDCLCAGAFDDVDRDALERIARLIVDACDW
ncbi:GAF domain-like protein, partial [Vararia minispora EC-137]